MSLLIKQKDIIDIVYLKVLFKPNDNNKIKDYVDGFSKALNKIRHYKCKELTFIVNEYIKFYNAYSTSGKIIPTINEGK